MSILSLLLSFVLIFSGTSITGALQTSTHTEQKTIEIELDSASSDLTKQIDLQKYSIQMPTECSLENVTCKESTKVHMEITKTWEITSVYELTDERLTPEDYSLYYPEINTDKPLKRNSDPKQVLLLQRALYERGLLPVLPTGRYGALTELGVLRFNQIKGIGECTNTEVIADPETLQEINAMKGRMADVNYLKTTTPPPLDAAQLCEPVKSRMAELNQFITANNAGNITQQLTNTSGEKVGITIEGQPVQRSGLEIDGYIKIKK